MKTNLTISLSPVVRDRVEAMRKQTGASDAVDVLRRALALLDFTLKNHEIGNRVVVQKPDGSTEVIDLGA